MQKINNLTLNFSINLVKSEENLHIFHDKKHNVIFVSHEKKFASEEKQFPLPLPPQSSTVCL
jgi:hypothetical protein